MIMERIRAVFFALLIILPILVATIGQINDLGNAYGLIDMTHESEEQNDEKGSEEKECKDSIEEYLAHIYFDILATEDKTLGSYLNSARLHRVTSDVLTPPPEYI